MRIIKWHYHQSGLALGGVIDITNCSYCHEQKWIVDIQFDNVKERRMATGDARIVEINEHFGFRGLFIRFGQNYFI